MDNGKHNFDFKISKGGMPTVTHRVVDVLIDDMDKYHWLPKIAEMATQVFIDNAIKDFDKRLQNYVTENLKELGFEFENDSELMEFISKRVHRIGFENRPNEWELYVDYQTENQKLIGTYNDNVSFSYEGSKVTATFGRSVGDKLQTKE